MTRKQLIDFILKAWKDQDRYFPKSFERLADDLIKEGIVKVDEPKEFWVVMNKQSTIPRYFSLNKQDSINYRDSIKLDDEIIHVREVVEE